MRPFVNFAVLSGTFFLLTAGSICSAGEMEDRQNLDTLLTCKNYQTSKIGETAEKSPLAASFAALLAMKDAEGQFQTLFKGAKTDAGKVYALLGLHTLKSPRYSALRDSWPDTGSVKVHYFGISTTMKAREMKSSIESGELLRATTWRPGAAPAKRGAVK